MRLSLAFASFLFFSSAIASPVQVGEAVTSDKRSETVSSAVYNDLVFYFKYASSSYDIFSPSCPRPNGNTLVSTISNLITDTQGFIARDDNRKEIVVVFRGSTSPTDFLTDAALLLVPFISPGVNAPSGTLVHAGFLLAWDSVASSVISTVSSQLAAHPDYTIVTSGHSLGGALSSLAGISLKQNFPNSKLRMYTYGQPRTGNKAYATFVNTQIGVNNLFRGVHTFDGVPTIIPPILGYVHHATEYWSTIDPTSALTTRQCNASGEDLTCSDAIISTGINPPHLVYYNILASTPFCS
ncbi:alpha/beta-hydrolase [Collybia nuda]|uniref:Alpha/beta-hydrolase n=1 Tax=Collybia nuda TaxID=64659 RepID=A0A9P6C9A9_9AGAR|nr:alpha/beta-hydrolase [Collybia nuda]